LFGYNKQISNNLLEMESSDVPNEGDNGIVSDVITGKFVYYGDSDYINDELR
jgi:hypothetical protein